MFDNGKTYSIMQGAGALYQISDASGVPPSALDTEGRAYTIFSQLEITAALGESVAAGETVTITIPASAGVSAPSDLSAPVVAKQADDDKCTHTLDQSTGAAVRSCNYEGMPGGDMSIAAQSTIRRVFASVLGRSSSNQFESTAKLSGVAPYQYDALESGPNLLGKPMTVYGA